jgi:hypothetical protein
MTITDMKNQLLAQLKSCREGFLFGHATMMVSYFGEWAGIEHEPFWFPRSDGGRESVPMTETLKGVTKFQDCSLLHFELMKLLRRALLSEPAELVKQYCSTTDQTAALDSSSLFQFARILRNSTSHKDGGTLRWDHALTKKKGIDSISWRHMQLRQADDGKELLMLDGDILLLHQDIVEFARVELK